MSIHSSLVYTVCNLQTLCNASCKLQKVNGALITMQPIWVLSKNVFNGPQVKFASSSRRHAGSSSKLQVLLIPLAFWVECKSVLVLTQNKPIMRPSATFIRVSCHSKWWHISQSYPEMTKVRAEIQYIKLTTGSSYFLVSLPGTSCCRTSLLVFLTLDLLSSSIMMVSPDLMFRLRRVANGL